MKALVKFTAVVGGKEKTFNIGDTITPDEAKELNLKTKPGLASGK